MKRILPFLMLLLGGALQSSAQCTATINAGNTSVCSGDSVYLTASPTGQLNYQWFENGTPISNTGSYYLSQNLSAGTYVYEVEITDNNNCVVTSAPVTVTVSQSPVVTLSNNGPLCAGGNLQLTANITNATTFNWWGPNSFASTQQNPTISNIQTNQGGWYYLSATNGGCSITQGTNVVVNGNTPTVVASTDSGSVCTGAWVSFNSTVTNLTGVTYSWTGPNSYSSNSPYPFLTNVTTAQSGIYTLTVTGQGCSGLVTISDTALLQVGTMPSVTASVGGTVCVGGTIQLNGSVSAGNYGWSGPMGFTSTQLSPGIANAQLTHSGNYTLYANDNGCTNSDVVYVSVLSNSPTATATTAGLLCTVDSMFGTIGTSIDVNSSGMTSMTYSWSGPNSFTSTTAFNDLTGGTSVNAGTYTVTVTGTGCSGTVSATSSVFVSGAACDSVWPGDADNTFDVNSWDILNIGLAYGATGTARTGASTSWVAQYASDWNTTFNNNLNHKYADCNGDGVVNGTDTVAVVLNYGQWHNKGVHTPMAKSAGFPDLYFDMSGIFLAPGNTVSVPIKLGTSSVNMQNIYGIAASVVISGITPSSAMEISVGGWMGDNTNALSVDKSVSNTQTDWALVRTNHSNVSGDGTIGVLTFTVPMGSENQNVLLYFDNVKMLNKDGNEITNYNVVDDNSVVYPVTAGSVVSPAGNAVIVPNPSETQAKLQFALSMETKLSISVTDITGRVVWSQQQTYAAGQQSIAMPHSEVATGLYNVQVRDDKGSVAQNLKWVRK